MQGSRETDEEPLRENNVYVKNLAPDVDDQQLESIFKVGESSNPPVDQKQRPNPEPVQQS